MIRCPSWDTTTPPPRFGGPRPILGWVLTGIYDFNFNLLARTRRSLARPESSVLRNASGSFWLKHKLHPQLNITGSPGTIDLGVADLSAWLAEPNCSSATRVSVLPLRMVESVERLKSELKR